MEVHLYQALNHFSLLMLSLFGPGRVFIKAAYLLVMVHGPDTSDGTVRKHFPKC